MTPLTHPAKKINQVESIQKFCFCLSISNFLVFIIKTVREMIVDHVRSGVKRVSDDSPLSLRLVKPWRSGSDNLRAGPRVDKGGHCFSPSTTHCYVILSHWAAQAEEWLDIANFLHFQIPSVFTLGQQSRIICKLSYFYLTRTWKFLIWPV